VTSQEYADILLAHWRLLWPLGPEERAKRFSELKLDYEFEEALSLVKHEMEAA
jgi:hypothetical protein